MSIDSHLKLDGVKGESTHAKHKDEIDVSKWNWSVHNASCTMGGGSSVGKGTPGMLRVEKKVDKSSAEIAKKCAQGKHFKDAVLTMSKGGDKQEDYMKITLKEAYIADYSVGANDGGEVTESVVLSYGDIEFEYKPQKPDGSMDSPITMGWDNRTTETR